MSSGKISADEKSLSFEINCNNVVGEFVLVHIDGDELNKPRIMMKMRTQSVNSPNSTENSTSVIITKEYTKVLSHFFKSAAEVMDNWYKEEK